MQVYVPSTVAEALELRSAHGPAHFLGGGTLINGSRWRAAGELVSLSALGLDEIEVEEEQCILGAMATWGAVSRCEALKKDWSFLQGACRDLHRINIRNQATVGGAVAASQTFSDLLPALWVLGASVRFQREAVSEEETLPLADWVNLDPGQRGLILSVLCPRPAEGDRFGRARQSRNAGDIATMKVLCRLRFDGDAVTEARVSLAVAGMPVRRLEELEAVLVGHRRGQDLAPVQARVEELAAGAKPAGDLRGSREFKQKIMSVLIMDALRDALSEGGEA